MATTTASKTATYVWQGVDKKGQKTRGEVSAANPAIVKVQLRKQGITAKSVKKKAKPLFESKKAITPMDIAIFSRQMATMMKAGVPLIQSFEIVAEGADNATLRELINDLKTDVAAGNGFAKSLTKHPKYFDDLFCNLVDSGEQSGTLETMLDRVATYKEKSEALKSKIKKAMELSNCRNLCCCNRNRDLAGKGSSSICGNIREFWVRASCLLPNWLLQCQNGCRPTGLFALELLLPLSTVSRKHGDDRKPFPTKLMP